LPDDFDERYFNAAASGLVSPRPLLGGQPVELDNVSLSGDLRFWVPKRRIDVDVAIRAEVTRHLATLDTLCIEPDERRVVTTWKVTVPCPRSFLHIRYVRVTERKESV